MSKLTFRNLLILLLIISLPAIFNGCGQPPIPPIITGIISGQAADPIVSVRDITGYTPIANATVTIVDADGVTHTTYTDSEGYCQFNNLSIKANTIINVIKELPDGGKKVYKGIVPLAVSSEESYDVGIADAESSALALVVEELIKLDQVQEEIDLDEIISSDGFDELKEDVQQSQEDNQDINTDTPINTQAEDIADNIVNPPTPPTPTPTPTASYTITFNKNDEAAVGSMSNQTIASGSSAALTANAFTKTGWTFAGWATTSGGTVEYDDEESYLMGTENVTLYARWTPPETYSLRDIGPAGGWIFYDKGSVSDGWRYLEAAPSDQSTGAQWGCYGVSISGADGTVVGTGEQNTIDIEAGCATVGTAADICANLTLGDYSDWFLPSKDELNLMYENLKVFGVGGFADPYYWSSSEGSANHAWYQNFGNGVQDDGGKGNDLGVRAVRAF